MTTHTEGLKPCPCCGQVPLLVNLGGWEILCKCGVSLCLPKSDKAPLIEQWNRRPAQASEAAIRNAALEEAAIEVETKWSRVPAEAIRALSTTPAEPVAIGDAHQIALTAAGHVMDAIKFPKLPGGDVQLKARIQCIIVNAIAASTIQPKG
jgi:hypothetical protein